VVLTLLASTYTSSVRAGMLTLPDEAPAAMLMTEPLERNGSGCAAGLFRLAV